MGATAFADLVDVSVTDGAGPARVEAFAAFQLVPGGPEEAERGRFAGTDLVGSSGQPDEGMSPERAVLMAVARLTGKAFPSPVVLTPIFGAAVLTEGVVSDL